MCVNNKVNDRVCYIMFLKKMRIKKLGGGIVNV